MDGFLIVKRVSVLDMSVFLGVLFVINSRKKSFGSADNLVLAFESFGN